MNNNLYLKYYLLLLATLNTINVSSFNLVGYFPRNNRIVNCSLRNLRMCSSSYLDNLNNEKIDNKLKNLTLSQDDIESNNILLNNLYNMYRFK